MKNNVEETCSNKMNIANQYIQLERCRMAIAVVSSIKSDLEKMLFDILDTEKSLKDVELCEISQLHEIRKSLKKQIDSFATDINESWFLSEKEQNAVRKYLNGYSEFESNECEISARNMAKLKNKEFLSFLSSLSILTMNENIDALLLEINKKIEELKNQE